MAQYRVGGWTGRKRKRKTNKQTKGTTSGPALIGGVGRTRKKNAGTKLPSPITQGTLQTLTLKIPKHRKQPKETDEDLKTRKRPGTTQGEKSDPKTQKHQEQPKEKPRIPRRRNYQKYSKRKNPENGKIVERGGDVKVNEPRPRLLNHLHSVGPPERTRWLSGPAGTKNLVRPPLRSCSAPGKKGA